MAGTNNENLPFSAGLQNIAGRVAQALAAPAQALQAVDQAVLARRHGVNLPPLRMDDSTLAVQKREALGHELEDAGWRWYEAWVQTPRGVPLPRESCLLFDIDGRLIAEGLTDDKGVVRFWEPPKSALAPLLLPNAEESAPSLSASSQALRRELADQRILVLPEILESFAPDAERSSLWGKNRGARDDQRAKDVAYHVLAPRIQGLLIKRAADGEPATSLETTELWKFSADGPNGTRIVLQAYRDLWTDCTNFIHLGIWCVKKLDGGFAPSDAATLANKGKIPLDNPPRFIYPYDPPPESAPAAGTP